jgi:carboxypeptidase Q
MMRRRTITIAATLAALACSAPALAQTASTGSNADAVLAEMWRHGMEESHAMRLAQALMDSVGPRLAGTPQYDAGVDWAVSVLRSWGIEARAEQYGTWNGWERGTTHIDLISPRVRTLEGTMLAWSPGTDGRTVEAPVVAIPAFASPAELEEWLPTVRGKYVAASFAQPTCRPLSHFQQHGQEGAVERLQATRRDAEQRFAAHRPAANELRLRLEQAGAVGILESYWSNELGVNKVFGTNTTRIPTLDLSCEDYGLVYRLAANGQGPVLRVTAESRDLGEVPVHNVIGTIPGTERPDEYVILSAHFDSWDAGSGATDNGTGTTTMLEAMRILRQTYPQPKRTILIGLWGGEEQGLNGSRRFVAMNPHIVDGIQALFNQDNGTGRIVNISMQGLSAVSPAFRSWLDRVPETITRHITLRDPGMPSTGGTDHASFVCAGAPAFSLGSNTWEYFTATWHTNRDTFDKIVEEEIRNNATLTAMLAFLASEHPETLSRERSDVASQSWPACQPGAAESPRAADSR